MSETERKAHCGTVPQARTSGERGLQKLRVWRALGHDPQGFEFRGAELLRGLALETAMFVCLAGGATVSQQISESFREIALAFIELCRMSAITRRGELRERGYFHGTCG